jgi:transcription initiation factor TFIIE subunit alpha
MQIQLLERVVEDVIGKSAIKIVDILAGKKDVNEFLIAKKLDLTINQARNILYKFSDYGLISSIRKKDNKKGWYIYYWTLNIEKSLNFLQDKLEKELGNLENKLKSRTNKNYYYCEICGLEINEETALGHNFVCPECGEVYSSLDNTKIIREIEKRISKLKEDLEIIKQEKEKIQEKQRKRAKRQERKEKEKRRKKRKTSKKNKTKKKSKKKRKKRTSKKNKTKKKSKKKRKKRTSKKKSTKKGKKK